MSNKQSLYFNGYPDVPIDKAKPNNEPEKEIETLRAEIVKLLEAVRERLKNILNDEELSTFIGIEQSFEAGELDIVVKGLENYENLLMMYGVDILRDISNIKDMVLRLLKLQLILLENTPNKQ